MTDTSPTEQLQVKYAIPYLYWGNFDFETDFGALTSINYLSNQMLDIAGITKPKFLELLDQIEAEIPAINSFGWWDTDMIFHSFATEDSDAINLLRLYKFLQYNRLFDEVENKLLDWFIVPMEPTESAEPAALPPIKEEEFADPIS